MDKDAATNDSLSMSNLEAPFFHNQPYSSEIFRNRSWSIFRVAIAANARAPFFPVAINLQALFWPTPRPDLSWTERTFPSIHRPVFPTSLAFRIGWHFWATCWSPLSHKWLFIDVTLSSSHTKQICTWTKIRSAKQKHKRVYVCNVGAGLHGFGHHQYIMDMGAGLHFYFRVM